MLSAVSWHIHIFVYLTPHILTATVLMVRLFFFAHTCYASLNSNFYGGFMTLNIIKFADMTNFMMLNIINFADMTRKEKEGVSWDVRRVPSP